ncbi:MAG: aminoacyl-tRNA hydrolase [Armatimonadetes bacterium]|nr:aminoacyl-tRNA hydrolase [Armatimonadota bacterium]MCX7969312.1 aminoacyl-tRNA hydrolase [Armatimonadota bacterium]MDW8143970.1 aminoacyl-tRNA hydrolase [Armatimonadota bacterium]
MLFWLRRTEPIDRLIVGIGNPGPEYAQTRHNVGFRVVNLLAKQLGVKREEAKFKGIFAVAKLEGLTIGLLKPLTYVNLSGQSVRDAVKRLNLATEQILVVLDDAQLPLGKLRLRAKGSSGGHKGLQSIIEALQTENIPRLRIGIGSPPEGVDMATFVLSPFEPEEENIVAETIEISAEAAKVWAREGIETAMQRFNR